MFHNFIVEVLEVLGEDGVGFGSMNYSRNIDVGDGKSGDYGGVRKVFRQDLNW